MSETYNHDLLTTAADALSEGISKEEHMTRSGAAYDFVAGGGDTGGTVFVKNPDNTLTFPAAIAQKAKYLAAGKPIQADAIADKYLDDTALDGLDPRGHDYNWIDQNVSTGTMLTSMGGMFSCRDVKNFAAPGHPEVWRLDFNKPCARQSDLSFIPRHPNLQTPEAKLQWILDGAAALGAR